MTRLKRKKELSSSDSNDVRFGTPELVAEHRAARLAQIKPDTIIEIGAGAGFQTNAFAKTGARVIAVDIDRERLERGTFPDGTIVIAGDALDATVFAQVKAAAKGKTAIFLDPERAPSAEHRRLGDIKPDIREFIDRYSTISEDIAIELPPFLQDIPLACEREYLSVDSRLNRLTIYLGDLRSAAVSVVRLPGGARIDVQTADLDAATSPVPQADVRSRYLLTPDAALQQAGIVAAALKVPAFETLFGMKQCFITADRAGEFFSHYRIVAQGKDQVRKALNACGTLILHGSMSANDQRDMLRDLNKLCKGSRRMHLFVGRLWFLTEKAADSARQATGAKDTTPE